MQFFLANEMELDQKKSETERNVDFLGNEIVLLAEQNKQLMERLDKLEAIVKKNSNNSVVIVMESCKDLGDTIIQHLHGRLGKVNTKFFHFGNNEVNNFPAESVRKKEVYIIGSGSNMIVNGKFMSINDSFMAICGMVRACRDASATFITVVTPYYFYSRSDKKDQGRSPIMARLAADLLYASGTSRTISIDLHASQLQGFFDGPFDNLYAIDYLIAAIKKDYDMSNCILVSPDAGGEKRVVAYQEKLKIPMTFFTKHRNHDKISEIKDQKLVDKLDFENKTIFLIDDICDTAGTLCSAAKILKDMKAKEVICVVTHGVFSGKAFENLAKDNIDAIYVTNTLPQDENMKKCNKIRLVDISELCADAILKCVNGESMSDLFLNKDGH